MLKESPPSLCVRLPTATWLRPIFEDVTLLTCVVWIESYTAILLHILNSHLEIKSWLQNEKRFAFLAISSILMHTFIRVKIIKKDETERTLIFAFISLPLSSKKETFQLNDERANKTLFSTRSSFFCHQKPSRSSDEPNKNEELTRTILWAEHAKV